MDEREDKIASGFDLALSVVLVVGGLLLVTYLLAKLGVDPESTRLPWDPAKRSVFTSHPPSRP